MAQQAQFYALNAYHFLTGLPVTSHLSGQDLATVGTLMPGVYAFDTSAQLTGALTLDFGADPDALFVFLIDSTLTTASSSSIDVLNGGENSGLYWQVGTSATLGSSTAFAGNILADQSITLNTTATIRCGRAIALDAAVTMDTNTISNDCSNDSISGAATDFGSAGYSGSGTFDVGDGGNGEPSDTGPDQGALAAVAAVGTGGGSDHRTRNRADGGTGGGACGMCQPLSDTGSFFLMPHPPVRES